MLKTSRDNIRKKSEKDKCKVYRIDSKPLEGKELEESPEESKTFVVETLSKKVGLHKMLKSLLKDNKEFKQKIREHKVKIREHEDMIRNLVSKENSRSNYEIIGSSRFRCVMSLVYELEQNINTMTTNLANKLYTKFPREYRTLVLSNNNKKKTITYYDALALESDSARRKLLNSIQENFDMEYKIYKKVDLVTVMPKLRELRRKRNKFSAHLFEEETSESNLKVKVNILLDIEKALAEGDVSEDVKEVDILILIAMNKKKTDIEKTNNKTLQEILLAKE